MDLLTSPPRVSLIVANYNAAPYVEAALRSALKQSLSEVEIIFVDDCSTDNSVAIARSLASEDPRLKVVALDRNGGPSRARNIALEHARGEWVAILDSDDLMHPKRLEWLLAHADAVGADVVADDLLVFYEDSSPPHAFLGEECREAFEIGVVDYVASNHLSGSKRNSLGFLKPLFKRSMLVDWGIGYDELLVNSEDYELVLQLLLRGATYSVVPFLGYFYRKHQQSISHRVGRQALEALLLSDQAVREEFPELDPDLDLALKARRRSIFDALALLDVVDALKSRKLSAIAHQLWSAPSSFFLLRSVAQDKWDRCCKRLKQKQVTGKRSGGIAAQVAFYASLSPSEAQGMLGESSGVGSSGGVQLVATQCVDTALPHLIDKAEAVMVATVCAHAPDSALFLDPLSYWAEPYAVQAKLRSSIEVWA